jgi:hypothetical protein
MVMSNLDEAGESKAVNPCFDYLPVVTDPVTGKPRGADPYATFHGMSMHGPALQTISKISGTMRFGGVEYLRFDATSGQAELDVTIGADASVTPRLRIARVH